MAIFTEAWRCPKCRRLFEHRSDAVGCCPNVCLMATGYRTPCGMIWNDKDSAEEHERDMQGTCAQSLPHVKDGKRLDNAKVPTSGLGKARPDFPG